MGDRDRTGGVIRICNPVSAKIQADYHEERVLPAVLGADGENGVDGYE